MNEYIRIQISTCSSPVSGFHFKTVFRYICHMVKFQMFFLLLLGSIIDFVLRPAIGHLPRSIGLCDSVRIFGLVPQYVFSTLSSVFSLQ